MLSGIIRLVYKLVVYYWLVMFKQDLVSTKTQRNINNIWIYITNYGNSMKSYF